MRNIFPQTRLQQKLPESTERASALGNAYVRTHLFTTGGGTWTAYGDGGPEDLHATHPSVNEMVRYSCSSGLGDVVLGSPLGLRPVSRCRGDFFLSPGLPAAPGGDSSGPLGDAVSPPPLGEAVAPARPLAPRVPLVDGLAVAPPDGLADAVAFGLAAAVARGLAKALALGEAVPGAVGEPIAPGLAVAPAVPAAPVVAVVPVETPTPTPAPGLTP